MSSTTTEDTVVEPNSVWKETNADGVAISYSCEYQTGSDWTQLPDTLEVANVVQYYDLVFPCGNSSDTKQNAADYIAQQLLLQAAQTWKILPDGEGCIVPQDEYNSWLFGISTGPEPDVFISDFGCQAETVDAALDECCQVVRMTIQFLPTGDYDVENLQDFVREQLDSGTLAMASLPLRTTPIDPVFTPPNVGPDVVVVVPPSDGTTGAAGITDSTGSVEQKSGSSDGITVPGGFLLAALVCAAFGLIVVMVRRHRMRGREIDLDDNAKAADDGTFEHDEPYRVSVLSDDADDCFLPTQQQQQEQHKEQQQQQHQQQQEEQPSSPPMQSTSRRLASGALSSTGSLDIDNMSFEEDDCIIAPKKYAFDLSQSFKNDVMGTYGFGGTRSHPFAGPTTMPVVAPYPLLDETSDSEADSWAQTDATVGSLEERLEEITAEI